MLISVAASIAIELRLSGKTIRWKRFWWVTETYRGGRSIVVKLLLPLFFQGKLFSAYEVLDRRFGDAVKMSASRSVAEIEREQSPVRTQFSAGAGTTVSAREPQPNVQTMANPKVTMGTKNHFLVEHLSLIVDKPRTETFLPKLERRFPVKYSRNPLRHFQ